MDKRKAVLFICDGLGDLDFNGKGTPLQAAKKPTIDSRAKEGITGLLHTLGRGAVPGSDTAHLALFGYDPHVYYHGRGPFEALGVGCKMQHGDVAFRGNFATVDESLNISDRRAGRIETEQNKELGKVFAGMKIENVEVLVISAVNYRAALILRGPGLSANIGDTDPHELGKVLESKPLDNTPEAAKTARILNAFTKQCYELLNNHPVNVKRRSEGIPTANILLARGAGSFFEIDTLPERYGIKCACIAGGALYKGVASYVGMEVLTVPGATGNFTTDVGAKVSAAIAALETNDFVFVHVKATDDAGHDGNFDRKREMIERIDAALPALKEYCKKVGAFIILTGDHSTPCIRKAHSFEPIPVLINGPCVRTDTVQEFNEYSCASGALGQLTGVELMKTILGHMGVLHMFGS